MLRDIEHISWDLRGRIAFDEPDSDHDTASPDGRVRHDLVPSRRSVKVPSVTCRTAPEENVEERKPDQGCRKAEEALVADCELWGCQCSFGKNQALEGRTSGSTECTSMIFSSRTN